MTKLLEEPRKIDLPHPCFNPHAQHRYARIHLPVAASCNMQCRYCNRKYNCVNESRPGVTSAVLKPAQALEHLRQFADETPNLSVVGIAGPGDPMACAAETLDTLAMVKDEFPHLLLCLATNGLALPTHVKDLTRLGVSHVTVTVNAVDPAIGARLFEWISVDGVRSHGEEAAAELWRRQQSSIRALAKAGVAVKVNSIYIPGYNDAHTEQIAKEVAALGAQTLNLMPLLPTAGSIFASLPEPNGNALREARARASHYLPQMQHCARCRADAAGLVGQQNVAVIAQRLQKIAAAPETQLEAAMRLGAGVSCRFK